jgi:hypothetical protein
MSDSYSVGYGKPPVEHQIKPGERKNPNGRRGGSRNAKKILLQEHQRSVRVTENGRTRKKSAIEVLMRQDMADALQGNERAKARQINLALQIAAEEEAKAALKTQQQMIAEDKAILERYLQKGDK